MIQQKQIKTSKGEILVIGGLPEDIKSCTFGICRLYTYATDEITNVEPNNSYEIPDGSYQSLGFLKDITEDVAKELVGELTQDNKIKYRNYKHEYGFKDDWWSSSFDTAIKSLRSLIEANCKLKNEYGDSPLMEDYTDRTPEGNFEDYQYNLEKWQAEQETVSTNPFLLKKI